jgi:hypothetical protein
MFETAGRMLASDELAAGSVAQLPPATYLSA